MTEAQTKPLAIGEKLDWRALLTDALETPGDLMGNFSRFHQYSFLNTLLLYSQGARSPVASYARWQSLNRQVMRGEKGMTIIRPINVKTRELDEHGEPKRILKFKAVNGAFQYSQTSGEEIEMPELPEWSLDRALETLDITRREFDLIDGDTHGFSHDRIIAVSPLSPYPLKTAAHEISHVLAGHTTPDQLAQYQQNRGVYEFVAEGAAFLTCKELGELSVEAASESRAYLQHWNRGQDVPEQAIRQVFSNTDKLIRAGRPAVDAMVELT
jgi:antirestriction protein ArdC